MSEPTPTPTPDPTPTPTPEPTPTPTPQDATATSWTEGLGDEHKVFVEKKGFKDPAAVLDSYKNLEKLLGAPRDKLLQLPDSGDKDGFYNLMNKLGRPQDKADYKIELPEAIADEHFSNWARDTFYEAGFTADQVSMVMEKYGEFATQQLDAAENQYQADVSSQESKLRMEWGAAYDQNIQTAQKAVEAFKIDPEQINVLERTMGFDGVMRFFNSIGSKIGEHKFVEGGSNQNGVMTPMQAQSEISELIKDSSFQQKVRSKDQGALSRWNQLHQWAYPAAQG